MAEGYIQPQLPPPNAPKYHYPGFYYYSPEPYQTTQIPKHHFHRPGPIKQAQHLVHEFAHPFGDSYPLPAPQTDIRETKSAYYLDIELPGLRDKNDVKLKWTGERSLFIDAAIQREALPEEEELVSTETNRKVKKKEKTVHFLRRERKTGELARGFNFPVDVKQDETLARLAYGVLSITVPKREKDADVHRDVEIEHTGH